MNFEVKVDYESLMGLGNSWDISYLYITKNSDDIYIVDFLLLDITLDGFIYLH